jgi:hypothetical protein
MHGKAQTTSIAKAPSEFIRPILTMIRRKRDSDWRKALSRSPRASQGEFLTVMITCWDFCPSLPEMRLLRILDPRMIIFLGVYKLAAAQQFPRLAL